MTSCNRERGLGSACVLVGFLVGCSGASFTSGKKDDAGSAGMAVTGGSSGTSGKGGKGGGGGKGATGGSGGTEAGSDGSGATGGSDATGGSSGSSSGGTGGGGNGGTGGSTGGASATGGDAGTSGTGGTGGSAGMSACITDQPCANEGDHCSEGGCCPCQHTCTDGKWSLAMCPPCAAPFCPLDPPSDGDECSACDLTVGVCEWDRCSSDNTKSTAECVDGSWQVSTGTCGNPACCDNDDECASGICVDSICEPEVPGYCWRDDDCGNGEFCSAVFVCPCTADCSNRDYPGTCVPEGQDCCRNDTDCASSAQCLAGVCKAPPTGGCWSDRDCGAGSCEGEFVCPCGSACTQGDNSGICAIPI